MHGDTGSKGVTIVEVGEQYKETIRNLYHLYLHDLSAFLEDLDIDEHGWFNWDNADMYWISSYLHPFLIYFEDRVAGFMLIGQAPFVQEGCDYCIQEFFILKKYRRRGCGRMALNELFKLYKGVYSLLILEKNTKALAFWRSIHEGNQVKYGEGLIHSGSNNVYFHIFVIE